MSFLVTQRKFVGSGFEVMMNQEGLRPDAKQNNISDLAMSVT